jgi:hypothetical protein
MTNLSSQHHSFDIQIAQEYGITEAIIIHHIQHWIGVNQRKPNGKKTSFRDGKWWTYQTVDDIAAHFPYLSKSQVVTAIERLCNGKTRFEKEKKFEPILVKGNFNKLKYDHTSWYSFVNEEKFTFLCIHKKGFVDPQSGSCGSTRPIPDTKTDAKETNKPEAPASASPSSKVVRSLKDDILNKTELTAPQVMKIKTQFAHLDDDTFKEAMEAFFVYAKKNPIGNLMATIVTALGGGKEGTPWTKIKNKSDIATENKKRIVDVLGRYDDQTIEGIVGLRVSILREYVEFTCQNKSYLFKYDQLDFKQAINKFLEKAQIQISI